MWMAKSLSSQGYSGYDFIRNEKKVTEIRATYFVNNPYVYLTYV